MTKTPADNYNILGHIDFAAGGYAYGWAFDTSQPDKKVMVQVFCNDELVAYGKANEYRSDLEPAGIGDGHNGFKLKLSYEMLDGETHELYAREISGGTWLRGGPINFGPEAHHICFDLINRREGAQVLDAIIDALEPTIHSTRENLVKVYEIGMQAQETGRLDEAEFAWKSLNEIIGDNALCFCKLGEIYLFRNDAKNALEFYLSAAAVDLKMHWAHLGISNSNSRLGNHIDALKALNIAASLSPSLSDFTGRTKQLQGEELKVQIERLVAAGNRQDAIHLLKLIVRQDSSDVNARDMLGSLLVSKFDYPPDLFGAAQILKFEKTLAVFEALLEDAENVLNRSVSHE